MNEDPKPDFPDQLFVIHHEGESGHFAGDTDMLDLCHLTAGEYVQEYRKVGKPRLVRPVNRQQHRIVDADGKGLTPWTTWEE